MKEPVTGIGVVLIATTLLLSGCVTPPGPNALPELPGIGYEFGDAQDPGHATLADSDGARHADVSHEWLGDNVNKEQNPKMHNKDEFDDGVGGVALISCETVEVPVTITVADREDENHKYSARESESLFLNMVFDFDNSSSWGGNTTECEGEVIPEWAVQNFAINPLTWEEGVTSQTINVPVKVGKNNRPYCYRATLTYGEKIADPDWTGTGLFDFGESEDYCPPVNYPGPFCGDGWVDFFSGERCDPPGSVCAFDGFNVYLCNNVCQCIVPDEPKFYCNQDPADRTEPYIAGRHVCTDDCPSGYECDAATCECEKGPQEYNCYNGEGWINEGYREGTDMCKDNCPEGLVCDSSCNCVPDDREEVSCAENTSTTRTRGEEPYSASTHICKDDCSEGFICDAETCVCEAKEEVSCAGNTEQVIESDENNFNTDTQMCADDCESGYQCNSSSCTCTKVEGVEIEVIEYQGLYIPISQLFITDNSTDACGAAHWHAESVVYAIGQFEGLYDPNPGSCGFGKVEEVPSMTITITPEEYEAFSELSSG